MRSTDPATERLLRVILRLEAAPWPGALRAYAAQVLALAIRCEAPAAKAEVYRWFIRERGTSPVVGASRRSYRRDALHMVIATLPGVLLRFRAGLDPGRRANLWAMLVQLVCWRAIDLHQAERRHHVRRASLVQLDELAGPDDPEAAAQLAVVMAWLDADHPARRALRLVGEGYSIAEAARMTGASRQQIYRAREALLAIWRVESGEA